METINDYLTKISKRGDAYGGHGGVLDLLMWCGKENTASVSLEEAKRFWEDPECEYKPIYGDIESKKTQS